MNSSIYFLKSFPLLITTLIFCLSCSVNKESACPNFKQNRSYSKKYQADYKVNKNHQKNSSLRKADHSRYYANNKPFFNKTHSSTFEVSEVTLETAAWLKSIQGNGSVQIQNQPGKRSDSTAPGRNEFVEYSFPVAVNSDPEYSSVNISNDQAQKAQTPELSTKETRKKVRENKKEIHQALNSYESTTFAKAGKVAMGFAIASFVCGVVGFVVFELVVFSFILGTLAIIFGGIALRRIRANPDLDGRGLTIAGMVLGLVDVILIAILFLIEAAALLAV